MEEYKKIAHYILVNIILTACAIFTILCFLFMLMGKIDNVVNPVITYNNSIMFMQCSLFYSMCGMFFLAKKRLGKYICFAAHFMMSTGVVAFYFLAYPVITGTPYDNIASRGALGFLLIYIVCYALIFPFLIFFTSKKKKKEEEGKVYTNKFKK